MTEASVRQFVRDSLCLFATAIAVAAGIKLYCGYSSFFETIGYLSLSAFIFYAGWRFGRGV